ncbi:FtsX-like permease family protein [Chitinophaga sedimenti]|uniref:FtsX-like permease family protein n=1 Tax=Chitinophaga sedimenti TaxID=2033606 RepID=UPI0020067853|nr:FtsX-like permease family protein [Chitinophaga sedimenti]MCK7556052.1 FtsX-like permease family protein [Chitinophaga sedimenti]
MLLIACINFMNLATARSEKRSREVGVRKVMGAGKSSLTFQFIMESLTMTALAVLVALACMAMLLPLFNTLIEKQLSLNIFEPLHLAFLATVTLVCGLVAGSYPSFYLSSFNPIAVLKGLKMKHSGAAYIRKGLVVFQFTTSIVLIIATIVIYQQILHVTHRELGYNKEHLLQADVKGDIDKYAVIRQQLLNTGMVEEAALSSSEMLYTENNTSGFQWDGKPQDADVLISYRSVSSGFFKTWGMTFKEGRDFHPDTYPDSNNIIITASLEKMLGKGSAVGKTIRDDNQTLHIIGVINDFVYGDMYGKSDPVVFYAQPDDARKIAIRLKANVDTEKAIAAITGIMEKGVPGYPFTYKFVDEQFNALFENEQLIGKLSRLFALLAILISCLGIFGLAAYMAEQRVKEIGVRKVLGASISNITGLLSKDFLQLVLISAIIAFPLAWFAMERWLNGYAYRIGISWWVFVMAGVAAMLIAP